MNQKLQNAFKLAEEEVKNFNPELKKVAFLKAVDYYLGQTKNIGNLDPNEKNQPPIGKEISFWELFSSECGISEQELKDTYSISKDNQQLRLMIPIIPGDSKKTQSINLAALILFAYHKGLNKDWVSSSLLAEAAKHSQLYSTSKFAKSLKQHDWFRTEGKSKGLNYKLSGPGFIQAENLLKQVTRGE